MAAKPACAGVVMNENPIAITANFMLMELIYWPVRTLRGRLSINGFQYNYLQ